MREVNKPSSMTSRTSARHRNIIQLSVGIEQLLKKPEGEESGGNTVCVPCEKLSSILIPKSQSDKLSPIASSEVAKLLVRVRTRYDAEYLKQRNRVKALEEELKQVRVLPQRF